MIPAGVSAPTRKRVCPTPMESAAELQRLRRRPLELLEKPTGLVRDDPGEFL